MQGDKNPRGNKTFNNVSINFSDVNFKYSGYNSPLVLRNINLSIPPGKTVAIVGESGCGKSTLLKLIMGFYIPTSGKLKLGGNNVKDIDNGKWLRNVGCVMQECRIFSGSFLENVALCDTDIDKDRAYEMIRLVGLKEFVDKLPNGIETNIGISGIEVSGGQRQRLMIARALYKNPELMILDEATSSLDAVNEKIIMDSIKTMRGEKTLIIAAHRLSTIQDADEIIVMKDGEIKEKGTHEELLYSGIIYPELIRLQESKTPFNKIN